MMNRIIESYMDQYQKRRDLMKSDLLCFLNQSKNIDELYRRINPYIQSLNSEFNYLKNFEVGFDITRGVMLEPWYYDPKYYSEVAIKISQNKQKKFVWINEGRWESEYSWHAEGYWESSKINEGIASELSEWICLDFPKDIKSMLSLIKEGYWLLNSQLPILSEKSMKDTNEVYSWDDKYVLTGTNIENIDMITIGHWERIVENEKCYGYMNWNKNDNMG
jgi:hypothetical protein